MKPKDNDGVTAVSPTVVSSVGVNTLATATDAGGAPPLQTLSAAIDMLGEAYGVDFRRSYDRDILQQGVLQQIKSTGVSNPHSYLDRLKQDPTELASLFRHTFLEGACFFRDASAWDELADTVVPDLVARGQRSGVPIRVWVPGCATGEEAYSIAVLFIEALERADSSCGLQIFANDISEEALTVARRGGYPLSIQRAVPPHRLERFFVRSADGYRLVAQVRKALTFALHDLLSAPPFSSFDLVSCRNVLRYLQPHARQRVLRLFRSTLKPDGILMLGAAEGVEDGTLFTAKCEQSRVYTSTDAAYLALRCHVASDGSAPAPGALRDAKERPTDQGRIEQLQAINEDLQANKEELERSKAELSALNQELVAAHQQLDENNIELQHTVIEIKNLLASAGIPMILLDGDLRIRRFTPAVTELMCVVASDVGRPVKHFKERVRGGSLVKDAEHVLRTLEPLQTEVEADSGGVYLRRVQPLRDDRGCADGVCVTFYDVTERTRAARAVDRARVHAETIVATVRTPIVVLDQGFTVVSANEGFCRAYQLSKADVVGRHFYQLGEGQWGTPRVRQLLERTLPERGEVTGVELSHDLGHDGGQENRRVVLLDARLMRLPDQELILLSIEDITGHRAAEEIIQARADELAQEHRRKDEFLAMLGHELRNPLSVLAQGIDLLEIARDDVSRRDQLRGMMARQVERIGGMLDQLLDVARLNAGKTKMERTLVDLEKVAQAAVESTTPFVEQHRHELFFSAPPETAMVLGDFGRLTQVIENLLTNAAKYTDPGGRIDLILELDSDVARVIVRDNGIGMDGDLLPYIFDLFTQDARSLERAAGGLGLGLPLVKRVVEAHDGQVIATSLGRGMGSNFVVTLPRMHERRAKRRYATGPEAPSLSIAPSPLRILVVDDVVDAARSLAQLLEIDGHATVVAHDGGQALVAAREMKPDVVLLDLGLPTMDGYEVARALRSEGGGAPLLIALTGYRRNEERLAEAGFDHHLIKPIDMSQLSTWLSQRQLELARTDSSD